MIKSHKTAVFTDDDGFTKVIYHSTKVVAFNSDTIVLNSGGYETKTTKDRINQTAKEYYLDYAVFQFDFDWYVKVGSKVYPFEDNMIIFDNKAKGEYDVLNTDYEPIKADEKQTKKYNKVIINNKLI